MWSGALDPQLSSSHIPPPGQACLDRSQQGHKEQASGRAGMGTGRGVCCGQQGKVGGSTFVEDLLSARYFYLQPGGLFTSHSSPERLLSSDVRGYSKTGPKHPTRRQQNQNSHVELGAQSLPPLIHCRPEAPSRWQARAGTVLRGMHRASALAGWSLVSTESVTVSVTLLCVQAYGSLKLRSSVRLRLGAVPLGQPATRNMRPGAAQPTWAGCVGGTGCAGLAHWHPGQSHYRTCHPL